jgi:predicted RNA-binding Zn-ribbon protein involved in translation (DUF1610 family)
MEQNKAKSEQETAAEKEEKVENPCPVCGFEMGRGKHCARCGYCYT